MGTKLDEARRRAWWWHRQGLDGSLEGARPAAVLERSGWARSVGGASPYLTFFSRAGLSRSAVDAAVAALDVHELPAARGCTYVVPASDYRLALLAGRGFEDEQATARKLGVTDKEIDRLCEAILRALKGGPLEPSEIRQAVGAACREGATSRSARAPRPRSAASRTCPVTRSWTAGRLAGLWEYDTETQSVAWWAFGGRDKALAAAVARTEAYVRAELGDARSFSLDSPKSRAPRVAALRKAAAGDP